MAEEKILSAETTKIKTAYSFNKLSYRKIEANKKEEEEMERLKPVGYCMKQHVIKGIKDIKIKRFAGKDVITGNCVECGTEIYKKRG